MRYHSSILDAHLLQPNDDFSDLPETHVIFITEHDAIGKGKPNPDDMYSKQLADKVRYFKEDEKGVAAMCKVMEDMRNETAERTKIEIAMDMIREGELSLEQIAKYSKLALDRVKEIANQKRYC